MNVEIGAEAAQFPEKEYINGIGVAVQQYNTLTVKVFCVPGSDAGRPESI